MTAYIKYKEQTKDIIFLYMILSDGYKRTYSSYSEHLKQAIENRLVYLGISAGSMIAAGLGYLKNLHLQEKR